MYRMSKLPPYSLTTKQNFTLLTHFLSLSLICAPKVRHNSSSVDSYRGCTRNKDGISLILKNEGNDHKDVTVT